MIFSRERYLEKLKRHQDTDFIKVVTGIRRVGKSTILELFSRHLEKNGVSPQQIIKINLDELEHETLREYHALHDAILEKIGENPDKRHYVFIDEVQNCEEFQKAIRSLYTKKIADLYISGSNAYMLSGELSTLLSGRYVEIEVFPLSFLEYTEIFPERDHEELFSQYLETGGFPVAIPVEIMESQRIDRLLAIQDSVIVRDILLRHEHFSAPLLQKILRFLASSIGSPVSIKNMVNTLNSSGEKTSQGEIESYLEAICLCYFFQSANNFDVAGRKILRDNHKFYIIDMAMRNLLVQSSRSDYGHVLENIVFLELRRRGYQVLVGSTSGYEVDFVAQKQAETLYIQVSATVEDPTTLERELRALQSVTGNGAKLLLTMDKAKKNHGEIQQRNLLDWLVAP